MEEKKLSYSQLSPEERLEVERYVKQNPEELQGRLGEAKAVGMMLQDARLLRADPPGDEALAYYITTRRLGGSPLPASLEGAFARIEERLAHDPALRARHDELARRIAALEAASDPVEQFERLSGRKKNVRRRC